MSDVEAESKSDRERLMTGIAETQTPNLHMPHKECVTGGALPPCILVILGASGDLAERKLIPDLFRLGLEGGLPQSYAIVGCGRTEFTDLQFRNKMKTFIQNQQTVNDGQWDAFAQNLFYRVLHYDDPSDYQELQAHLLQLDETRGTEGNRIFYLAVPPAVYETAARMIGQAGLAAEGGETEGWSRIVVEKPFGKDLESAVKLDAALHEHFSERQIFRIDHYLAKETVQNVLMFRFANAIFEPIWNRRYIQSVNITAAESLGVERRAGYYETAGVLRDMFQNHMMQLLSLTAMEPCSRFDAEQVRNEKAKVFRSLRPFPVDRLQDFIVLGQYTRGTVDGRQVPGYREEEGVDPASLTPTFASMKIFIDNWRWQGVPFYLTSGKRMGKKVTEIAIQFREIPHSMFRHVLDDPVAPNRLTLRIFPEERISLVFQAKNPGAVLRLRPVSMDFCYTQDYQGPVLDAYQKVLMDCIRGDQMLFWREDGVELCWSFLTPIIEECEACRDQEGMLRFYEAGSWGPAASFLGPLQDDRRC